MINSGKSTPFNSIPLFFINKPSILSLLTFCLFAMYFFFFPPLPFFFLSFPLFFSPSFLLPCSSLSCLHHSSHLPPSLSPSFLPSLLFSFSFLAPLLFPLYPSFLSFYHWYFLSLYSSLPIELQDSFVLYLPFFVFPSSSFPLSLSHYSLPVTVLVPFPCLPFHLPFLPLRTRSKFPSIRFAKGKKINKMGIGIKNKIFIKMNT